MLLSPVDFSLSFSLSYFFYEDDLSRDDIEKEEKKRIQLVMVLEKGEGKEKNPKGKNIIFQSLIIEKTFSFLNLRKINNVN